MTLLQAILLEPLLPGPQIRMALAGRVRRADGTSWLGPGPYSAGSHVSGPRFYRGLGASADWASAAAAGTAQLTSMLTASFGARAARRAAEAQAASRASMWTNVTKWLAIGALGVAAIMLLGGSSRSRLRSNPGVAKPSTADDVRALREQKRETRAMLYDVIDAHPPGWEGRARALRGDIDRIDNVLRDYFGKR